MEPIQITNPFVNLRSLATASVSDVIGDPDIRKGSSSESLADHFGRHGLLDGLNPTLKITIPVSAPVHGTAFAWSK